MWWEFWPEQSAAAELDGSLARMGFDYVDLIYANPPPDELPVAEMVAQMGELVTAGKARAWGIVNWEPAPFLEAARSAQEQGVSAPCAAQLPYGLVRRDWVESAEMIEALQASGAGIVASFVMAGGVLTGKYDAPGPTPAGGAGGEGEATGGRVGVPRPRPTIPASLPRGRAPAGCVRLPRRSAPVRPR